MVGEIGGILTAAALVFVAELGDKSQLVAFGFGARHRASVVIGAMAVAYGLINILSVTVGAAIDRFLPDTLLSVAAGLLFLGFAVWTWREDEQERGDGADDVPSLRIGSVAVSIVVALVLAELGDKTMLVTAALASAGNPVPVWIGATFGLVTAGSVGVFAGRFAADRIDTDVLRKVSAGAFAVFGTTMLVFAAV